MKVSDCVTTIAGDAMIPNNITPDLNDGKICYFEFFPIQLSNKFKTTKNFFGCVCSY